jgi:hypothetical protein
MRNLMNGNSVEQHFAGVDPVDYGIYDALLTKLRAFGPIEEDPKKTCIHLNRKSALAGVYIRKDGIRLEFKTAFSIENSRIKKSEQISRNRWHHVLPVASVGELDEEVMAWLKDAWDISG